MNGEAFSTLARRQQRPGFGCRFHDNRSLGRKERRASVSGCPGTGYVFADFALAAGILYLAAGIM